MSTRPIKKHSVELEVTDSYASAVSHKKPDRRARAPEDFVMNRQKEEAKPKLLSCKALNENGECDDKHFSALAKMEIWSDEPRFFLKRLPAHCFFNPWNYNKGTQNDVRYSDKYGRKPHWVEVPKFLYDMYLKFLVGDETETGAREHNVRYLSQVERIYINEVVQ